MIAAINEIIAVTKLISVFIISAAFLCHPRFHLPSISVLYRPSCLQSSLYARKTATEKPPTGGFLFYEELKKEEGESTPLTLPTPEGGGVSSAFEPQTRSTSSSRQPPPATASTISATPSPPPCWQDVDIMTVAALLGDTVETVAKTYVHYTQEMRGAARTCKSVLIV